MNLKTLEINSNSEYLLGQHADNSKQNARKKMKKMTIGVLSFFFIIYCLIPAKQVDQGVCIIDNSFVLTNSQNQLLHQSYWYKHLLMLIGQIFVDLQLIAIVLIFLFRFQSFLPLAWMLMFYVLRNAVFLNTTKLPYPLGIYWDSPGFPSLGVPYGIARDFFYSGHTGFCVFSLRVWADYHPKYMKHFSLIGLLLVVYQLTITRVHYSIDIFAGWLFSQWMLMLTLKHSLQFLALLLTFSKYSKICERTNSISKRLIQIKKNTIYFLLKNYIKMLFKSIK